MSKEEQDKFRNYKKSAAKAAKELMYGEEIIRLVKAAVSYSEIERAMISGRRAMS